MHGCKVIERSGKRWITVFSSGAVVIPAMKESMPGASCLRPALREQTNWPATFFRMQG
ncbi:MAG: hypothetical protein WDO19_32375 [Bacteroidota bacterium]